MLVASSVAQIQGIQRQYVSRINIRMKALTIVSRVLDYLYRSICHLNSYLIQRIFGFGIAA
jgi:hypothetical protein